MTTSRIQVEPYVAEYVRGKYFDADINAVRFPPASDVYHLIYDLMARRPGAVVVLRYKRRRPYVAFQFL